MKREKREKKQARAEALTNFSGGDGAVRSDVLGSWTGSPLEDDQPVQDADDL